jgi:hypothetical protein
VVTRPRGEIRFALAQAYACSGPTTWRTAAQLSQVGYEAARRTTENMVRAGELQRCGAHGSLGLYVIPGAGGPGATALQQRADRAPAADLVQACTSWAQFR